MSQFSKAEDDAIREEEERRAQEALQLKAKIAAEEKAERERVVAEQQAKLEEL